MASNSNSLDEILFQPATNTVVRAVGKFRPKPKSKLNSDIPTSSVISSSSSTIQPRIATTHSEAQAGTDSRHTERLGAKSSELEPNDVILQSTTTAGPAVCKFQPKAVAQPENKKALAHPSLLPKVMESTSVDHKLLASKIGGLEEESTHSTNPTNAFVGPSTFRPCNSAPLDSLPSEVIVFNANGDLDVAQGRIRREELPFSREECIDDILFQPTTTKGGLVGKFQPKPIARPKSKKSAEPSSPPVVAESGSPLVDPPIICSQIEGLEEGSTPSTLPYCASADSPCIHSCNSAPIDPSTQHLVTQVTADMREGPHSECVVSDRNIDLQMDHASLEKEADTVFSGLDLDDILFQPSTATGMAVGKFRPKLIIQPKSKEASKLPSVLPEAAKFVSPPVNPQVLSSEVKGLAEGPPLSNAPISASADPLIIRTSSSASVDPSSQLLVAQDAADLIDIEHSKASASDANENLEMDNENSGIKAATVTSGLDSLDDILFQPTPTTVRGVHKFQPKPKAPTTTSKSFTPVIPSDDVVAVPYPPTTTTSKAAEFISPPFDAQFLSSQIEGLQDGSPRSNAPTTVSDDPLTISTCGSAPIDYPSSQLLVAQEAADLTDVEHSKAAVSDANKNLRMDHENSGIKAPTVSAGLDSLDEIIFQQTTTIVPGGDGYLESVPGRSESAKARKRKTSTIYKETVGKYSAIGDENEAGNVPMQLRKRTAVLSPIYEVNNGIMETSNLSMVDDDNESDNDNNVEDTGKGRKPPRKKAPRGTKRPATDTDKPGRRSKKASDETDPINKEPTKKKFSHSTRRNRRSVSKELLETPEEDIDPRMVPMKDLIILAEIKERRTNKEAEALKRSFPNQSADNSIPNDAPYDDEDPLASTQGLHPDNDQADHRAEPSCPKLNYHSFMNRTPSQRWSKSDTEMFYEAIRQFGTDFSMIQQLFPGRTRHQVKLKYKAEQRKHPLLIADASIHRSKDHSHFELVIERLQQAQAEQNAEIDSELPDVTSENEEPGVESKQKGEEVAKEESEVHSPVKSNASQDVFDWSQYGTTDASSSQDMEKYNYGLF